MPQVAQDFLKRKRVKPSLPGWVCFFCIFADMNSLAIVIAPVVHSVVFEWNQANHLYSYPHWEDLIDTDRARIVEMATFLINNPNASEVLLYNNFRTTEITWEELSEVEKKSWMLIRSTVQVLIEEV